MNTKNKIKRGVILLIGLMAQNVIAFSQSLLSDMNPDYNYQLASHFATSSIQPLEVIKEHNKTTLVWNVPDSYEKGVIAFCNENNKIITTHELNGKQTGKMDIYGNTEQFGFYSYKLIVDGRTIGADEHLLTPVAPEPGGVSETLSSK